MTLKWVTTHNVIAAGGCPDGVIEWRDRHVPTATAIEADRLLEMTATNTKYLSLVRRAIGLDGCGPKEYGYCIYGYGDFFGNGHGDRGYGQYGFGDPSGDGNGYGKYGYADSNGNGFGEPTGNGEGDSDSYYSDEFPQ